MDLMARGLAEPPSNRWYLISIYGSFYPYNIEFLTQKRRLTLRSKYFMEKGLSLCFDDMTPNDIDKFRPELILFNKGHAKEIIDFAEEIHKDPNPAMLAIHCHAGISRSGAVGVFISNRFNIHFEDPYIRPNEWVLRVLETGKDDIKK